MEIQLLREPEIFPTKEVLKDILGEVYNVLEELETILTNDEFALSFDWQYYNDGKSWLCKVCHKKKTVFWLSIWDGFFKTSFFFLERHLEGIAALQIEDNSFTIAKALGKLIPLLFNISNRKQLPDLLKVIEFKKKAK
jgi:hypothetical protein